VAEPDVNAIVDLEGELAEDHQKDDSDDFEPEGEHEDVEFEINPDYVLEAEVEK
jgi:hypothetical protein